MARYRTLRRNVDRNIKHWSEEGEERIRDYRMVMSKVMAVAIALSIAFSLVPLTMNIVFRIPDLYKFDIGRTGSITDEEFGTKDASDKIANMISQFMRHKSDEFQISATIDDNTVTVFSAHDGIVMQRMRLFLDNTLVIGITLIVMFFLFSFLLVRWGRFRELNRGFASGVTMHFIITALVVLGVIFKGPAMTVWKNVIGVKFLPGDKMPTLFFDGFVLSGSIAMTVLSIVILLALFSLMRLVMRGRRY